MIKRRQFLKSMILVSTGLITQTFYRCKKQLRRFQQPNIILLMTDDQGWGETGYYRHPVLKTPNLDAMAANGLRFDRFYAGAPVCSPTRATVLTGRTHDRTGVLTHGYALRLQEKTLSAALKRQGYATAHFGKWHLNGLRGPGVPIFADDSHAPAVFGFDEWLSVTNFFDINPLMSRKGEFQEFSGITSEIIVSEALQFIEKTTKNDQPFFTVIWDGSPHDPWVADARDRSAFADLDEPSQHHYGELAAFDRSVGMLRSGLRKMGIAGNTLIWYCSDNGGLPGPKPDTVGGLRGYKGSVWEGGLRVPAIIEWPSAVKPRITDYPASTMDIFPSIADLLHMPKADLLAPVDGVSLKPLLFGEMKKRNKAIPFRFLGKGALVDNNLKLVATDIENEKFELYDLAADPQETTNIADQNAELFQAMKTQYVQWNASVEASVLGKDYPQGKVKDGEPQPHMWMGDARYQPYLNKWRKRPEYAVRIERWEKQNRKQN